MYSLKYQIYPSFQVCKFAYDCNFILFFYTFCVRVCIDMCMYVATHAICTYESQRRQFARANLLPPCGSQGLNIDHWVWQPQFTHWAIYFIGPWSHSYYLSVTCRLLAIHYRDPIRCRGNRHRKSPAPEVHSLPRKVLARREAVLTRMHCT